MKSFVLLLFLCCASLPSLAQTWTGTPNMYNQNTGNVAIGPGTAVTPLAKLHIFDGAAGEQLRFTRGAASIRFVQGNGLDNLYLYNRDASKMYMFWKENGFVGIGTETPTAKLHVHNDDALGQTLWSNQLLSSVSGRGNNYFTESKWLVRDDASSAGWTTARMHNGISIDGSYLTPGTDTRTWWERDPYNNIQSWGQGNQTYMTVNTGNLGIGTTNPSQRLHLTGAGNTFINIEKVADANEGGVLFSKAGSTLFYLYNDDVSNALKIQAGGLTGEGDATPRMQFPIANKNIYMAESGGNVGIGTTSTGTCRLAVEGKIGAREVNVLVGPWPDYVFEKTYNLLPLTEVENYIKQNKHLPEVPAAKEMEANGVNLGEMNMLLLKKVEELTLYLLDQQKTNQAQSKEIELLKSQVLSIKNK